MIQSKDLTDLWRLESPSLFIPLTQGLLLRTKDILSCRTVTEQPDWAPTLTRDFFLLSDLLDFRRIL